MKEFRGAADGVYGAAITAKNYVTKIYDLRLMILS